MNRRIAKAIFVTVLCCVMLALAVNADFAKTNTYSDGMFKDVKASHWFAESVKDAYEFGLMKGMGDGKFSPDGTLTVAEGLTIASRIHQTLNGTTIPTSEGAWYQTYVDYAKNSGFMRDGQFDSYTREIKRYEMASLLADVCKDLPAINTIGLIPDVSVTEPYEQKVLTLYRSGILTGNDDYGTFMPFSNLKRSEISAMAVRIADSTKRVSKTFKVVPARTFTDAYMMAYVGNGNGRYGIANAWKYDNRFDIYNRSGTDYHYFKDTDNVEHMSISRKVNEENDGIVTAELGIRMNGSEKGVYAAFQSTAGANLVAFTPVGGKLAMVGAETVVTDIAVPVDTAITLAIDLDIDLDKNTATAVVNNKTIGTVAIPDMNFGKIDLFSTAAGTGFMEFNYIRMYKNYVLCEHFIGNDADSIGKAPAGWNISGFNLEKMIASGAGWTTSPHEVFSAKTDAKAGTVSTASKSFEPTTGKVYFQTYVLLPKKTDGAVVSLKSAGADVLKFETKNGKFVCNGKELYDYVDNAWYRLSVDADTNTGIAEIKINSKLKATVKFTAKYFDGVDIKFAPKSDAVMWFDDVELYPLVEHYDYPSQPVVAESKDYNIGVNICNLWLDSSSAEGWDVISPFPELDMYLGYYDEGLRETADWETKFMVEHGIDFMHLCWYSPTTNPTNPIKKAKRAEDLEDGYMNGKYSDLLKFCIMWENGGSIDTTPENFKEYMWKYWMENYFKDDRYLRLDGKAVISLWNKNSFETAFGGVEGCKEMVAFMEEELKKVGYDGLILLCPTLSSGYAEADFKAIEAYDVDALYGYHWGTNGYSADYQIKGIQSLRKASNGRVHIIPTVSVGFNSIARHDERYPFITAADHLKVCEFIKEDLANQEKTGTWKDNTVFVSSWNEYSEGTHVMPNNSTGWDLLDNIRNTFTDASEHADVMPTDAQKARIDRTYPANYAPIRRHKLTEDLDEDEIDTTKLEVVASFDMSKGGEKSWGVSHGAGTTATTENGIMTIIPGANDHGIRTNSNFVPFDASKVTVAHIIMKNEFVNSSDIFFTTDKEPTWSGAKCVTFKGKNAGEWVEYYVDLNSCSVYKDTITAIRFDPMTGMGKTEIKLIEFLAPIEATQEELANKPKVLVNGYEMKFKPAIEVTADGDYKVTGEARYLGFYSTMRLRYDWDRFTGDGVLTLTTYDDTKAVFTVGSDKVVVNGVEKPLGYTFSLYDGLPVFEMKKLCEAIGYEYTMNGGALEIKAMADDNLYQLYRQANLDLKKGIWSFSLPGDTQTWSFGYIGSWEVSDGTLKVTAGNEKPDPKMVVTHTFSANDYNTVVVRVKYNDAMKIGDKNNADARTEIFFKTAASNTWSADKSVRGTYDLSTLDENGFIDAVFYLSESAAFKGTVLAIRYDPYQMNVDFEVDEIRLEYRKMDSAETKALLDESGLILDENNSFEFDTEDETKGWTTGNSTVTFKDGFMTITQTGEKPDPSALHALSVNCNDYERIVVGVKYDSSVINATNIPQIFFKTVEDPTWNTKQCISGQYVISVSAKEGDIVKAVFNVGSSANFTGTMTNFRFDPFQNFGTAVVDYIRFYQKEKKELTDAEKALLSDDGYIFDAAVSFEFNESVKGIGTGNCTPKIENGFLTLTPGTAKPDPAVIFPVSLKGDDYSRLVVGVKYIEEMKTVKPELFFTTTESPNFSTANCLSGKYVIPDGTKEGTIIRVVFDLAGSNIFKGDITKVRFDPFNLFEVCEIDYLRFFKPGDGKTPAVIPESTPSTPAVTPATNDEYILDSAVSIEFDAAVDGLGTGNCTPKIEKGFLTLIPGTVKPDPAVVIPVSLKGDDYARLVIGVKYIEAMKTAKPELFFTTTESPNFSTANCMAGKYVVPDGASEGDIIEVVFDFKANAIFKGDVTKVRFDPFNLFEVCEIDYLRFFKPGDGKTSAVTPEPTPSTPAVTPATNTEYTLDSAVSFEFDGAVSGLGTGNCTPKIEKGFLTLTPGTVKPDPAVVIPVSFKGDDYARLVIGVKYIEAMKTAKPELFFTTAESPNFSTANCMAGKYVVPDGASEGDIIEVVFDFKTNAIFKGDVTKVRFDPFNLFEVCEIDYLRFYK